MENKEYWDNGTHLWVTSKDMKTSLINDSMIKISDEALKTMQVYQPGVNGNQQCSNFGNSECSIFGIKTTVLLASAVQ